MARAVYLHVGAPKTGTTYLQSRLARNRAHLAARGVDYPIGPTDSMFLAAVDLIERPWGGLNDTAAGEWDALVERVRGCRGTAVISQEILAAATPQQVERAMAGLHGAEVHVVYSARDLARQIPSEWQEGVKHWHLPTFERFLGIVQGARRRDPRLWFWRVQGLPDVLRRWAVDIPASRVHVVTVPPAGAGREVLWGRYCRALGIDPAWAPLESDHRNLSLGAAEATLVRRLNRRLEDSMPVDEAAYGRLVRRLVVHEHLAHRPGKVPVTLPPEAFDWAEEVADQWVRYLSDAGFDVVGDLEDLRPVRPDASHSWPDPDDPDRDAMLDAALEMIEVLLVEAASPGLAPPGTVRRRGGTGQRVGAALRVGGRRRLSRVVRSPWPDRRRLRTPEA